MSARRLLPHLLVLVACAWVFRRALVDGAPMGVDNPVHFFRAELFWDRLWRTGRIAGWTSEWVFGYPAEDVYPPGTVLWVALTRVVTLDLLEPVRAYGLAVFAAYVVQVHALYLLARRFVGGPAALLGALLWLLDPGGKMVGGYYYLVHAGVWGQSIALGFFLYGWEALERRDTSGAGAWWAAALLCHLATLPMVCALLLLRLRAARALPWMLLLAAFWFLPFWERRGWGSSIGESWVWLGDLGRGLLAGNPTLSGWAFAAPLAAWGVVRTRAWAFFTFGAGMAVLATHEAHGWLLHLSGAFAELQYPRFLQPAKVVLYPLAGAGLVGLVAGIGRPRWRVPAGVLVVFFGWTLVRDAATLHRLSGTLVTSAGGAWRHVQEVGAALKARSDGRFARVVTDMGESSYQWAALPLFSGLGVYPVSYTPAKSFRGFPALPHPEALWAASVRWRVALVDGAPQITELPTWSPQRWTASGATVEELRFDDEQMAFRVTDAVPGAALTLHVAGYPRWEARLDGVPVSPRLVAPAPGFEPMLLQLQVADGELVVAWVTPPIDRVGAVLTGLGVVGWGLVRRRRNRQAGSAGGQGRAW